MRNLFDQEFFSLCLVELYLNLSEIVWIYKNLSFSCCFSWYILCCCTCPGSDTTKPAKATQREEAYTRRCERWQILRTAKAKQLSCQEIQRCPQVKGRRNRNQSQFPGEGECHPSSTGRHTEGGGQLITTAPPTEAGTNMRHNPHPAYI